MKKGYVAILLLVLTVTIFSMSFKAVEQFAYKQRLSEYGLFEGKISDQQPVKNVMPYSLNSPLFSDYAQKLRFVQLPSGEHVAYNPDSVFQFPVGTTIAKTFYYYNDEKDPSKGRRLMETRILIHEAKGWKSLPYIWNEDQTDAMLEVAGGSAAVAYLNDKGEKISFEYTVPNMNQCKSCHESNGKMTPIGPSARQLNGNHDYATGKENQLKKWSQEAMMTGLPQNMSVIPQFVNYSDPTKNIDDRAKAYLDINCAHCHNKTGPAQTSGLFLDWRTTDKAAYGFFKTPIAAGRGSGNLQFDIHPGKPNESILLYRMQSTDPGVMMPEVSRKLIHAEGVKLISDWIKSMKTE
jgi:uncharacterized repeat protein (TIGR03806 family)